MGGDYAPGVVIEGAYRAVRESEGRLHVLLYGPEEVLRVALKAHEESPHISVVHAPQVIGMGDSPVAAVRAKPRSSIHCGLMGHKEGRADAFLSAGNTGANVAASLFVLGRLPGVFRPSIPTQYPTTEGVCTILDVGSNMDSKPEHLLQFAKMGSAYARIVSDIATPRVGLLSVGEEPGKGNELVRTTHELLVNAVELNFIGNVEGRDILHHRADVVVCDGFVGNVVLKLAESMMTALPCMIEQEIRRLAPDSSVMQTIETMFAGLKRRFDPAEYGGGSPLLGVEGEVFILHGRSSARAIERCLLMAARAAKLNLTGAIRRALAP